MLPPRLPAKSPPPAAPPPGAVASASAASLRLPHETGCRRAPQREDKGSGAHRAATAGASSVRWMGLTWLARPANIGWRGLGNTRERGAGAVVQAARSRWYAVA